jgi:5-methylcytosine-specific restriction endonuclease McrA
MVKICCHCHEEKNESCFSKSSTEKDGLYPICRTCVSERGKKYKENNKEKERARYAKYRENNKEKLAIKAAKHYKENPRTEYFKKYNKEHSIEHAKVMKKVNKNYYEKNKEKLRKRARDFAKSPEGKIRYKIYNNKRRGLEKNVENTLTEKEIDFLIFFQNNKCARCNTEFDNIITYTLDHIIPVSKGGGLILKNVQLLCKSCNSSKNNKSIQYRKDVTPEILEEYIFNYSEV